MLINTGKSWVWWHTPVILAFRRVRQEDLKFKASLGYFGGKPD